MKILITGVAGFIGFSFAKHLLNKKIIVYGIDNLDNYYSVRFKNLRVRELRKSKNFHFKKIDITKKTILKKYFANKNFDFIFHFAAQAGVRYSLINPKKYLRVNRDGFENVINNIKKMDNLKRVFYASSSSVYGSRKKFPSKENSNLLPQSIYAKTKLQNENFAKKVSDKTGINLIGLRFFTVYGEWGRPDMFIFKILYAHKKNKLFYLNNYGNHERDFTYIKDVVTILEKLIRVKIFKHKILNICSSRPINIKRISDYLKKKLKIKKIIESKKNNYDVNKTHGDNRLLMKYVKFKKFTNFKVGLNNTVNWYLNRKIFRL
tara:strand:+ start:18681 stop:19640 length:960 start_codon:yes stop_codon:yes gene_type:complete